MDRRFVKKESVDVERAETGEIVLYDFESGAILTTNEVGYLIWTLIECLDVEEMSWVLHILTGENIDKIRKDIQNFMTVLLREGLIKKEKL